MNRCPAFNKNNKRCRALTKDNKIFCCKLHEPLNNNIIDDGCFICMEKILISKEIIYFKCKHAFHKGCYSEWLNFSTYETSICILCRRNVNVLQQGKKKKDSKYCSDNEIQNLINIKNILSKY